jgi:deoxycytidine triphosphate deaminase
MTVRRSDDVAFIGTNARKTPRYELAAHLHHYPEILCVESGHYYLFETLEAVNMPLWLTGILTPRTTLFRSGIIVSVGALDPGYKKRLAFGAFATHDIHIERGARIVSCRFAAIGDSTAYNGVWQGGKIHTDGEVVEGFDLEL